VRCIIRNLAAIRDLLRRELTSRLCTSLIISRLDCCNSVLSGVPKCSPRPLHLGLNMAARHVFNARRSCQVSPFLDQLKCLPIEKRIEKNILTPVFKARNGLCPSYLPDLLHAYVPARTLRSSDTPTLTVPNLKLTTVGDRSFCSVGPRLWNLLPHSLRAGALACSDATPGNVTALLRLHLLATHFVGLSSDQTLLLHPSVVRVVVRKRFDSPQGCEHAIKKPSTLICAESVALCNQRTEKNVCMYTCWAVFHRRTAI